MRVNGNLAQVFGEPQQRSAWLAMRLTASEKQSIRVAAKSVNQTLTGYLLGLHLHYTGGKGARHV